MGDVHRWRSDPGSSAALVLVLLGAVPLAVYLFVSAETDSDRAMAAGLFIVLPFAAWLFVMRPYVELSDQGLVVRNPLRRRTVPVSDIRVLTYSRYGLDLGLTNGKSVVVWVFSGGSPRAMSRSEEFMHLLREGGLHELEIEEAHARRLAERK